MCTLRTSRNYKMEILLKNVTPGSSCVLILVSVNIETPRFHFTEYCLAADREYNVIGTCAENPQSKDEDDPNVGSKRRTNALS